MKILEEEIREVVWNLCKTFYGLHPKIKDVVRYSNYVSNAIESLYGAEIENDHRKEAEEEIKIFSETYMLHRNW